MLSLCQTSATTARAAAPRYSAIVRCYRSKVHVLPATVGVSIRTPVAARRAYSTSQPLSAAAATSKQSSAPTPVPKVAPAEPWRRHISPDAATPTVYTFFEKITSTWQYIVVDPHTSEAVIVDPVLDYDANAGAISTGTADGLLAFAEVEGLKVRRILETHAHADHLTAAQYIKQELGGDIPVCIGKRISQVQKTFAPIYGLDDPSVFEKTFDCYFDDDEEFKLGQLSCCVIHLPGHTPDHVGYLIGKAVFTGDSIFNPDVGSARADFPGGNAEDLYASMQRLLSLPPDYRLFVGHDYPQNRDHTCWSTVEDQRVANKHLKLGTDKSAFIEWREQRDAVLGAPRLLHPSLQVNIRAGRLPPADANGRVFFRIPITSSSKL
ncbi:Metallo-hydrolase/oxidoreductase [Fomitopsis serialis]|uniref:Metallo-hydrolase/oxidoreductase n=1 Tax=Fomitopsis serialis TaxID=139415 RepID=UPI0020080663|nr:Metallo-hydrolase/oxidoreductase [Neoantrodia serialis]KAH9935608.1 Metallo-hydrolase/oxidoreductase [Neoantrodia serialis]